MTEFEKCKIWAKKRYRRIKKSDFSMVWEGWQAALNLDSCIDTVLYYAEKKELKTYIESPLMCLKRMVDAK